MSGPMLRLANTIGVETGVKEQSADLQKSLEILDTRSLTILSILRKTTLINTQPCLSGSHP